jgi:hypothetical protein
MFILRIIKVSTFSFNVSLSVNNETLKLNVDTFIILDMNIDYNAIVLNYLLVMDFPQPMMLRSTMLHRCPRWI